MSSLEFVIEPLVLDGDLAEVMMCRYYLARENYGVAGPFPRLGIDDVRSSKLIFFVAFFISGELLRGPLILILPCPANSKRSVLAELIDVFFHFLTFLRMKRWLGGEGCL